MAITKNESIILFYAKKLGVSFERTLTLGRLNLYATHQDIKDAIVKYKNNEKDFGDVKFTDGYAEPLFEILGAKKIDSVDFSPYEKPTIVHDLNDPIPNNLKNNFTAIVDGGTIEHIFNFPVAIKNCMEALKVNGHYIGITPTNNNMGHGFYQFSPELYYRIFSEENGFKIVEMLININLKDGEGKWYSVADPKIVKERVSIVNKVPISLIIIAQKIADVNIFAKNPQQSDYLSAWSAFQSISDNIIPVNQSRIKFIYRKIVPNKLKSILRNIYRIFSINSSVDEFIGEFNPNHFKEKKL